MKNNKQSKSSRRSFLTLGLLGGASVIAPGLQAQVPETGDGEHVKLLTPDGKLVEVPREVIEQSRERKKVSNADILKWSKSNQKLSDDAKG